MKERAVSSQGSRSDAARRKTAERSKAADNALGSRFIHTSNPRRTFAPATLFPLFTAFLAASTVALSSCCSRAITATSKSRPGVLGSARRARSRAERAPAVRFSYLARMASSMWSNASARAAGSAGARSTEAVVRSLDFFDCHAYPPKKLAMARKLATRRKIRVARS